MPKHIRFCISLSLIQNTK